MYLLTIATKYAGYLRQFYDRHKDLSGKPYDEQYKALMADSFGSSEIWSVGMANVGYHTERIYANARPIQQQWAVENGLKCDEQNWIKKTLFAQVKSLRPDIIFVNNHTLLDATDLKKLREENPSIRLVIGWCGIPFKSSEIFKEFDIVLSNIPELVENFKSQGLRVFHVNHAFDPRILQNINIKGSADVDVSFVGSIIKDTGFHIGREKLLMELASKTDIQIWGNIQTASIKDRIRTLILQIAYDTARLASGMGISNALLAHIPILDKAAKRQSRPSLSHYVSSRLAKRVHPPVYGLEMFQRLRNSKITLNTHIDISSASASNMRLYEAAGVGACVLTDWKDNLKDLYEPEVEVATYRDSAECIEKIAYLLQNEKERQAIAEAGQKRTLNSHTIYHRAEQINEIIRQFIH
jgi:spore maturation protein CgeB